MENGKRIVIYGNGTSQKNMYVKSVTLNGKRLKQDWFRNRDIENGTVFRFKMSPTPTKWGFDGYIPHHIRSNPSISLYL
jgi:putative alpha-1,2-mannosidase